MQEAEVAGAMREAEVVGVVREAATRMRYPIPLLSPRASLSRTT